jgi:carbonic anhydrase
MLPPGNFILDPFRVFVQLPQATMSSVNIAPTEGFRGTDSRRFLVLISPVSRRSLFAVAGAAVVTAGAAPAVAAPVREQLAAPKTPKAALARLRAGNRRFVADKSRHPRQTSRRVHALAAAQDPFAIVLGCADSRVSPEVVFDQGLGDVFDNRVAGNIVDDLLLGSIEYAVEHFSPPLLIVLGHERCGAIVASLEAIESGATAPGHIGAIVEALRPTLEPVLSSPGDQVENGVLANIRAQRTALVRRSEIVREHVESGAMAVVGARYDLDTGRIKFVR